MSSEDTLPVYVSETKKRKVKSEAGLHDLSMKEVIERLVEHGIPQDLHRVPTDEDPEEYDVDAIEQTQ
jgi:hypothetical protein